MSEHEDLIFDISTNGVEQVKDDLKSLTDNLNQLQTVAYGALGLLARMGLGEDATRAIRRVQQLIAALNMLRVSMIALQTASGPVGWALIAIGVTGTALTLGDSIIYDVRGR